MRNILAVSTALALTAGAASAQSLMLNFRSSGQTDVAAPYFTLDPAHATGAISALETTWNNFSSAASSSSLKSSNGLDATGVSIVFGNETAAGSGTLSYLDQSQIRTNVNLGTGGSVTENQGLIGGQVVNSGTPTSPSSIYGQDTNSTAVGRTGWLGQTNAVTGFAIGMRIDGLAVGDYVVYIMARNTNTNGSVAMNLYTATGASTNSLTFSSLTPVVQSNPGVANNTPDAYNNFVAGETYVAVNFSITGTESLYIISDGGVPGVENRGFLNMVQIAAVPEPAEVSLAIACGLGLLAVVRRRKAHSA